MSLRAERVTVPLPLLLACAAPFLPAIASPGAGPARSDGDEVTVRALRATLLKARAVDSRELDASEKCALPEGALVTLSDVSGSWDGRVAGAVRAIVAVDGSAIDCALPDAHGYGPAFAPTDAGSPAPLLPEGDPTPTPGATPTPPTRPDPSPTAQPGPTPPLMALAGAVVFEARLASVVKAQATDSKNLPPARKCNAPTGSRFTLAGVSRRADGHYVATSVTAAKDASGAAIPCSLSPAFLYEGHFRQVSGPAVPGGGGAPGSSGFAWPTSGRGIRNDSGGAGHFGAPRGGRKHTGIDILAQVGEPLFAAAAGSVVTAGWAGGYGNLLQLGHASGRMTSYAHLSSFVVRSRGAWVGIGGRVALAGRTGNSGAPEIRTHLHFEILENGTPVDPLRRLPR